MKPDSPLDDVGRAHLVDPDDHSFTIARRTPARDLTDLARRFWIPVWSVPAGLEAPQHVLQYPVCLIVVAAHYARFYGVASGLSTTTLVGSGWGVGLMLQPAAGHLLTGRPVSDLTDRFEDLGDAVPGGESLTRAVRAAMAPAPHDPAAQETAAHAVEDLVRTHLPVDAEGLLVNRVVARAEGDPGITRVAHLCEAYDLSERSLQRLTRRRVGLTPKWLIQRRRLQEASEQLRDPELSATAIAADLGYADQAHFTRDFRRVTGLTPGAFAARFRARG
ncbi:transcriptional regulator, AraC family [Beutenbergia cavernae DSM 12333]|uniref:Transcriptional regulator, AraC family n=1 Tax=Beutenbergia cavernae (strain ATCC BAA-8 / DSM 12333 / CCUG 43141 / JCM 11478 / NBRC 16432 / NCIMB 13614 / HKI 0122) TaxID=471853 RepID=C5BZN5_BEUC1|nr:helix-turn-helix domain-containing protein [Beutenbergia cavernae]ACQ81215.1 transcriptional regulator, AraC family [Beutenbergia cavernae DSM 12333]